MGLITINTALLSVFYSGVLIGIGIWLLIQQRRQCLLNIRDPGLRQKALEAMVNYLNENDHSIPLQFQMGSISGDDSEAPAECRNIR